MEGFDRLLSQFHLRDAARFRELEWILSLAERLQRVGLVPAYERTASGQEGEARPDLRLIHPGVGTAYLELSVLGDGEKWTAATSAFDVVTKTIFFHPGHLQWSGRLLRPLAQAHLDDVLNRLRPLLDEVATTREFRRLEIPSVLEVGFAGEKGQADLNAWAEARGLRAGEASGPEVDENRVDRLIAKINHEQAQLPEGHPGIIVIPVANPLFSSSELVGRLHLLEEEVFRHPRIGLVVVTWRSPWPERQIQHLDPHSHTACELLRIGTAGQHLLVRNRFAQPGLSPSTYDLVRMGLQPAENGAPSRESGTGQAPPGGAREEPQREPISPIVAGTGGTRESEPTRGGGDHVPKEEEGAMETDLSRIHMQTQGGRELPQRTEMRLRLGRRPGHVGVELRLPGASQFTSFGDLPIRNGEIQLPVRSTFICYAKEDFGCVNDLATRLWENGVLVWMDVRDLLPGDRWRDRIDEAIERADFVIVALSERACSKIGEVQREIKYAIEQAARRPRDVRYLLPILVGACEPPRELRDLHWVDICRADGFQLLLKALKADP